MSAGTIWEVVPGATGIFRAQYKVPFTTPSCTLVDLGDNRYLVYSPGPGLESTLAGIVPDDAQFLLIAPSTGHYLGILPWSKAHPTAQIFASEDILEKLARKTRIDSLRPIADLDQHLPSSMSIHIPPPHFLHEIWIRVQQDGASYWLVSDAFLNFNKVEGNFILKFLLGFYGMKPGLRLHKLFPLGLDKAAFRQWAEPLFNTPDRHVLLPCHQDIYSRQDCGEKLVEIVRQTA